MTPLSRAQAIGLIQTVLQADELDPAYAGEAVVAALAVAGGIEFPRERRPMAITVVLSVEQLEQLGIPEWMLAGDVEEALDRALLNDDNAAFRAYIEEAVNGELEPESSEWGGRNPDEAYVPDMDSSTP